MHLTSENVKVKASVVCDLKINRKNLLAQLSISNRIRARGIMDTVLDDDKDLLELVLSALEGKLQEAEGRRDRAQDEANEIQEKMERVRSKINAMEMFSVLPRSLSGRMKRGQPERLISTFLRNRNGAGAT